LACHGSDLTSPSTGGLQSTAATSGNSVGLLALTGRIAFVSDRAGNAEIYVIRADGTGLTRLTNNTVGDGQPAWSHDGTKIAFVRGSGLGEEIYVMNANGTGVKRLTNNNQIDENPAWSPDGTKIVFASTRETTYRKLYVMNANGSGVARLTQGTSSDVYPTWSPDGSRIAFERHSLHFVNRLWVGTTDIAVIAASGGGALTLATGREYHPAWSPDGTKIVFSSARDNLYHNNTPAREIYRMSTNGSGVTRLTTNTVNDDWPTWSPDGSKVAFESDRNGNPDIYIMNPNGTGVTRLTFKSATDGEPAWGP
jgi:Tol biopolymer transport system component